MKTLSLICFASVALENALPTIASEPRDTLDLNVTFVGDREVLMRDAHKEMHWPEPVVIERKKQDFVYTVLPKRIDVEPAWDRRKPKRLKVEDPLQRLYKGFVEAGLGNYKSPFLLVSYADLRSRERAWGMEYEHTSTQGGFWDDDDPLGENVPQNFSTNSLEGWYKSFFKKEYIKLNGLFDSNVISYYGRISGTNEADSSHLPFNEPRRFSIIRMRAEMGSMESAHRSWNHLIELDYGTLWNDLNTNEHNFDVSARLEGHIKNDPITLHAHVNIDRLERKDEGLSVPRTKQAIIDVHPAVYKNYKTVKTKLGFGMWVDAQGNQPFLFVPELEASVSLLQDLFIPYVLIEGGVDQNRFETALQLNPYLPSPSDSTSIWKNSYETLHAKAGMRGSITSAFTFDLSASHRRINQAMTWSPLHVNSQGASFQPIYQDLSITTLQADAHVALGSSTSLQGQIQQHTYAVRDTALSERSPWNLPRLEINIRARHSIKNKFIVQTGIIVAGGRRGLQAIPVEHDEERIIQSNEEPIGYASDLTDMVNWNMRLEYRYNSRLGAWLSGENLLNKSNPILIGYNSQGTRVSFGFNYAF
ncbi:MAG TPA: hypothetical protein DD635_01870 [Flavobacteriales bacterium]|nr:hypothetical protein [Flavobacteriales bacterium]|tara:strand:- start:3834 stop:5600 length:1767 start_codon:yes stop_codon:yes gene_type:complete